MDNSAKAHRDAVDAELATAMYALNRAMSHATIKQATKIEAIRDAVAELRIADYGWKE